MSEVLQSIVVKQRVEVLISIDMDLRARSEYLTKTIRRKAIRG